MDAKQYRQVRQLFDAVLEQPLHLRSAYLDQAGAGDAALCEEVRRLLDAADYGTELFDQPPVVREGPGPLERWEGRHLGPYQILRELGEGGMGIVYLGRRADGAFEKEVAIKIVRQQLATPQFFERFQREREILARLEHPHIARLLDGGISPPFLVMEFVRGEPLLSYADSRRLSYDGRLALLRQVASAVDYAHRQGVIHRDLKPGNIFVTNEGDVKLLDFGIAAWQQNQAESELSPTLAMSPAYASPEQIRGLKTNSATDIYSLGLVSYELLAGMPPFRLDEVAMEEVLRKVVEEEPSAPSVAVRESKTPSPADLSKRRQMAPIQLLNRLAHADGPLLRALSKRREERPPTAASLIAEMEAGTTGEKPWPAWLVRVSRQWDMLAFHLCFLALVAGADLRLSPIAWVAYLWGSAAVLLTRLGYLKRLYALSPTVVFSSALFSLMLSVGLVAGTNPRTAGRVSAGMALVVAFTVCDALRYYFRRKALLGNLLFAPKSMNRSREWAVIFAAVVVWFAYHLIQGHTRQLMALAMISVSIWFSWKSSFKPLQVREKGLVVPSALLPWSSIQDYRWRQPAGLERKILSAAFVAGLEFRIQSPIFDSISYLRVYLTADDREKVQEILRNWLLEADQETA